MRALLVCVAVLCARPLRADGSAAPPNPARRKLLLDRLCHELGRGRAGQRISILGFLFEWKNFVPYLMKAEDDMIADNKVNLPRQLTKLRKLIDSYGNLRREELEDALKDQLDAEARSAKTLWSPDRQTSCPTLAKIGEPDDACSSVVDAELCRRLRDNVVSGSMSINISDTESRGLVQFVTCIVHRLREGPFNLKDEIVTSKLGKPILPMSDMVVKLYGSYLKLFWIAIHAFLIVMLRGGASWCDVARTLFARPSLWRVACLCPFAGIQVAAMGTLPQQLLKSQYGTFLAVLPPEGAQLITMPILSMMLLCSVGSFIFISFLDHVRVRVVEDLFRRFRRGSETTDRIVNGNLYGALLCGAFLWLFSESLSFPEYLVFMYLQCYKTGAGAPGQWRQCVVGAIAVRSLFSDGFKTIGIPLAAAYWYMLDEEPEFFDADYVGWCVASLVVLLAGTPRGGTFKSGLVYPVVGAVGLWLFAYTVGHDLVKAQESLDSGKRQRKTAARDRKAAVAARREAEAEQRRRLAEEKAAKAERNRLAAEAKAAESERKLREARNEAALARARKAREEQEAREREKRDARAAALAREEAAAAWSAKAVEDEQQRLAAEAKAAESERKLRAAEAKAAEEKRRRELAAAEDERRRLAAEAKAALAEKKLRAAQKKAAEEIRRREAAAAAEAERERRAAAKIAEYEQRRAAEAARAHEETKGETVVEGADPVVAVFLASLDLSELLPRFVEESVDADVLPCLTAEDLAAMGVRTVSDSASPPRHRDEFSFPRRGRRARSWRASSARSSARRSSSRRTTSTTPRCTRPRSKRRWRTIGRRCGPARELNFTVRLTG